MKFGECLTTYTQLLCWNHQDITLGVGWIGSLTFIEAVNCLSMSVLKVNHSLRCLSLPVQRSRLLWGQNCNEPRLYSYPVTYCAVKEYPWHYISEGSNQTVSYISIILITRFLPILQLPRMLLVDTIINYPVFVYQLTEFSYTLEAREIITASCYVAKLCSVSNVS